MKIAGLMRNEWEDELARNGLGFVRPRPPVDGVDDSDAMPCPACGTTAPLVKGACSDCGLMLE